jgi:undecaprenyl-diphosphatase
MFELEIVQNLYLFFLNNNLIYFWKIITDLGSIVLLLGLLALFIIYKEWLTEKGRTILFSYSIFGIFGIALKEIITFFYFRIRPYKLLGIDANIYNSSFFSMHTYIAFITAFYICLIEKNTVIRVVAIILAILIAFSRLALAYHYLTDVLFAILLSFIFFIVIKWYTKKKN